MVFSLGMTIWGFEYGAFLKVHSNRVNPSAVSLGRVQRSQRATARRCVAAPALGCNVSRVLRRDGLCPEETHGRLDEVKGAT